MAHDAPSGQRRVVEVRTPTGPLAMIRPVAEQLLANGVISGDLDGDVHAADAATVRTAILMSSTCDFCSAHGAPHVFDVPDFDMPGTTGYRSVDGWAACDACAELVRADKRKALLERSVERMAFSKFTRPVIAELHARFWKGMGDKAAAAGVAAALGDYIEDRLPAQVQQPSVTERDLRIDGVCQATGLTRVQVQAILVGEVDRDTLVKLVAFEKQFGKLTDKRNVIDRFVNGPRKPLADIVPHWQRALDAKFEAASNIADVLQRASSALIMDEATDLNDPTAVLALKARAQRAKEVQDLGFVEDAKTLRVAQAYSFNAETAAAIAEAARAIPRDAPLSSISTPNTGAGWFWFSEPLPLAGTPMASDVTDALLWCWTGSGQEAALRFSAYIVAKTADDPTMRGKVLPGTRWFWPLRMSFQEMLAYNRKLHRRDYGEGGRMLRNGMTLAGEEETLRVVSELSLFFVMACLWFKQTVPILTREAGHVERHARKRMAREHKLTEPPTVQVVALRKSQRVPADDAPIEHLAGAREYHCKWVVTGHPRLQACGPGRKDRKLIWIDSFIKGPDDAPLRTRDRVYAVIR